MNVKPAWTAMALCILLVAATIVQAQDLTAQLCRQKVVAAAALLEKQGSSGFAAIKDPKGEFRFGNGQGYVWIQDLDGIMVMHPIATHLDGKGLYNLKDDNGVYFFMAFNEIAEEHGAGWVSYLWPKPGQKQSSPKVSYVKLARYGDESYVVGAGLYDVTADQIMAQFPDDPIYGQ